MSTMTNALTDLASLVLQASPRRALDVFAGKGNYSREPLLPAFRPIDHKEDQE